MLNHEIGTHYLRDLNEGLQPWRKRKEKFRIEDKNPTEEGLASLHTVLEIPGHDLWRPAVLYFSTWFAATHSFAELFAELNKYVHDPDERWAMFFLIVFSIFFQLKFWLIFGKL